MATIRRRKAPEVLWRLFNDRARTLAETIISMVPHPPPSPQSCLCKGRGCLQCCQDAMSFLLKPGDHPEYRRILNRCFIVINRNAPPTGPFYPQSRWPQNEIVPRVIEMMLHEEPMSSNVICSGYNKYNRSSPIVKLLTGPAWGILSERVGDDLMLYLLKYTSIFLPLSRKKHHQVSGSPISNFVKLSKHKTQSQCQFPSVSQFGPRWRSGSNISSILERQQPICLGVDNPFGSDSHLGSNDDCLSSVCSSRAANNSNQIDFSGASALTSGSITAGYETCSNVELHCSDKITAKLRKHPRPFSGQGHRKRRQLNILETGCGMASTVTCLNEAAGLTTAAEPSLYQGHSDGLQDSNKSLLKLRKHSRPFSWQRSRKRRRLNFQENNNKNSSATFSPTDESSLPGELKCDLNSYLHQFHKKTLQICSCCSLLQASQLEKQGLEIDRHFIFYDSKCSSSLFPPNHILDSLKPNFVGSRFLIANVFRLSDLNVGAQSMPCSHRNGFCLNGSTCQYHSILKLLKNLIRRARCCQYLRLLDKHCPFPSPDQNATGNTISLLEEDGKEKKLSRKFRDFKSGCLKEIVETNDPKIAAIKSYCSKSQVVSFIWSVCRSIVPPALLGSPSNQRRLRRNVSKFIRLRRFEKFSLKQCMHKLKTSGFEFLSNNTPSSLPNTQVLKHTSRQGCHVSNDGAHKMKQKFLEIWTSWFFSCLIVPLVQAHFYVTESQHGKQDIYYYQKPVWERLRQEAISCLKDHNFKCLGDTDVRKIICTRSFGFSKLRLCPKENGVRMLANLRAPSRMAFKESLCGTWRKTLMHCDSVKFNYFKPVNFILRDAHAVLRGLRSKEPDKWGSSVFDYNEVYRRLCPFLIGLKNGLTTLPELFIVVSDVSKAFDSIDQDKLLSILKEVIVKDQYFLQQSDQVVCSKKSLWVHNTIRLTDKSTSSDFGGSTSSVPFGSLHSVLVDLGCSRSVKKEELFFNLYEHVKHNVLLLDRKFYLQSIGIPQGGVCSSLLCSLYYGHLERNVIFPFLEKTFECPGDLSKRHNFDASFSQNCPKDEVTSSKYVLLRFIDDFLFVSTSKKQAVGFFSRLQRGFRDYNCYMNEGKFCFNFDVGHVSVPLSNMVCMGENGISFLRWSGLLLNCSTLEVQADYTRYLKNKLSSTLTVTWHGKPGRHLKAKLRGYMRPKCHSIFFDSNVNSAAVVRLNVFQAFLLCAMKFHCYVADLSYICKLQPRYYFKMIEQSLRYMHSLIKKRIRHFVSGYNFRPVLQLEGAEVEWLGLNAYIQALNRKQSRHKKLLSLLKCKLMVQKIASNVSSELKYAVDPLHSSFMWKIKY
ncbi:telomerase reverse transcriptase-like [Tripterygium wilfordii]|uniref:Telomerase reverse transcriptase n=1 Tax=Tripterygium wilfordii TaxID=458696 RepID=A0A7J7CQP5_TRIWF|nr:telomerase reverse transcriptase [Tripterygium wilfordii]KAF5736435.1 telomerase reverse transcriptase-like [Tripterygium wilfordii]